MTTRYRGLDAIIPNQENVLPNRGKPVINSRVGPLSRPALGEVGNKLHTHTESLQTEKGQAKDVQPRDARLEELEEAVTHRLNVREDKDKVKRKVPAPTVETQVKARGEVKPAPKFDCESDSYSSKKLMIVDPDISSQDQPQMVAEYVKDIFDYLKELEDRFPIRENFLENHESTPKMRMILVNWLVEVHTNFKLCLETLHLAVGIVDRYLQRKPTVGRKNLQLVGVTALFLACKYEEMCAPVLSDFVYTCDDTFTSKQILAMEIKMLKGLDFCLGRPASIHFLRRFSKVGLVRSEHHTMAKYFLELMLLNYEMAHIKPSRQAAAALCLSVAVLDVIMDPSRAWSPTLVRYTGYRYSDFKPVIVQLAHLVWKADTLRYQAVRKKYSTVSQSRVSKNQELTGPVLRKLICEPLPRKC